MSACALLIDAENAYRQGDIEATRRACEGCLRANPREVGAWILLGVANRDGGRPHEAEACWRLAAELGPERFESLFNLAHLLRAQGRREEAAACFEQVTRRAPGYVPGWQSGCETLLELDRPDAAIAVVESARQAGRLTTELLLCQGNAFFQSARPTQAAACYQAVLDLAPAALPPRYNLALAQARAGLRQEAIATLRVMIELAPGYLNAHIKLADLLADSGDPRGAACAYRAAIALKPELGELHNNLGKALRQFGEMAEAIRCFETAIQLGIRQPVVYLNLGGAYQTLRRQEEALATYRQGLALDPDDFALLTSAVHVQQMLCDWNGLDRLHERLVEPALKEVAGSVPPPSFPFLALPTLVTSAEQRRIADNYANYLSRGAGVRFQHARRPRNGRRLRIGYVSADFHNHATAHLMLGLFKRHDRTHLEIWAYSLGADDGSHYRQRIAADCDRFVDLGALSDDAAAARLHDDGIDIVVDLKGYTGGARPAIFARRPAPVQVQYLGYPGTMGGDFIDYLIVDRIVLPEEDIPHYAEAPVWMPHCYQINDGEQPIAESAPTRAECGLPERGFVFCCFNSPYKIEPTVFAAWMRMLAAVPDSVLWLYAGNPTAVANRRQAAADLGIDPTRLVFAEMLPKDRHLARHRHADLFLDTLYYNAHTTGSDALWAGVPMLTLPGSTFASRVGESLVRAVGLEQLIVPDLDHYVARAVELARQPAQLAAIREQLARHRLTWPLFDTAAFARGLDHAYLTMWARWEAGLNPAPIAVPEQG